MGDIVRVNEMMNVKSLELCLKHSKETKYITIIIIIVVFLLKSLLDYVFGIHLISVFISDILGEYDSYIIIGYVFVSLESGHATE